MNDEAKSRKGNSLKQAAKYLAKPGIISLGGGLPSCEYFPFAEMSFKVPQIGQFTEEETERTGKVLHCGKNDLVQDKSIFDISTAFNYGQGTGAAQFLRWIIEHTEIVHNPPYADWSCNMSVGSTSGLDMGLRMFCERGDYIISEEYTFSAAVETALPLGVKVVGVKIDEQGLIPDHLDHLLQTWDPAARGGARKPFVVYTVPTGQNPTGATQGLERRKAIYRIAQKHDLFIIEDEPYYFLQMPPYGGSAARDEPEAAAQSPDAFLRSLVPSYLSMDVDGRVLRLDSFSKVIAPGTRVGWVTGAAQVVECYRFHADVSTQCPSGIAQLLLFKLLDEHWGHDGYLAWLAFIRAEYTTRRGFILAACERHLPREFVSWQPPAAGMFHWMRIDWAKHPLAGSKTIEEIEEDIFMRSIDHGSLVMRGSFFYAEQDVPHDTLFFRATYAAAPADKIDEAIRRFGEAVRESFGVKQVNGTANGSANGTEINRHLDVKKAVGGVIHSNG